MTHYEALYILSEYFKNALSAFKLPVKVQKGDSEVTSRAPDVYKMRLPHSEDAKKVAPYCIVRYVSSVDSQATGREAKSKAVFRFIFCVYDDDESTGSLNLLNVMDRMKIKLLKDVVIGGKIRLVTDEGLEMIAYEDDTWPYFAGEMIGTFEYGPIEREVYYEEDYRITR